MAHNLSSTAIPIVRRSGIERRHTTPVSEPVLIRLPEVMALCALSRSGIYEGIKNKTFPAPVKLNGRPSAWVKQEVPQWINAQIVASRRAGAGTRQHGILGAVSG